MGVISKYKVILLYIIVISSVIFGVSIVFGSGLIFDYKVSIKSLSNNIFLDSRNLKNNLVVFTSYGDLSKYSLETSCDLDTRYLGKKENNYFFSLTYKDNYCLNPNVYLKNNGNTIEGTHIKFNIFSEADMFNAFTDISTNNLNKVKNKLEEKIINIENNKKPADILTKIIIKRELEENNYKLSVLNNILETRSQKYIVPIVGKQLSTKTSKIPNAKRPYRETYTDGIHHGWDVDADYGDEVVALDYGLIIRIVEGFQYSNLSKIDYRMSSPYETKLNNLDILRGNQVWLKTSKGDIVFYSHLSEISSDINVGMLVAKGKVLGKVGRSGVPDKNYTDYHLHFPIQKNPYNLKMAGKYSFKDYMKWDWYFKGKDVNYVLNKQNEIFNNKEMVKTDYVNNKE